MKKAIPNPPCDGSSATRPPHATEGDSESAGAPGNQWLETRHFTHQAQRPTEFAALTIESLDPLLRSLLFTDGTVTRALEVHALAPTTVEVRRQSVEVTPEDATQYLDVPVGTHSVQRRVAITVDRAPEFVLWAESHLLPGRLPTDFFDALENTPGGIGASFQQAKLEGWRELLWFGLSCQPVWSLDGSSRTPIPALRRLYRVFTHDRPALLISESFPVECRRGEYRLLGL